MAKRAVRMMDAEQLDGLLECEDYTITLWVGFLGYVNLAVDHGHNTVTELQGTALVHLHTFQCTSLKIPSRG